MNHSIEIDGYSLTIDQVVQVANDSSIEVTLSKKVITAMKASRDYIESRIQNGEVMYGVNTGFGAFSSVRISDAEIDQLQKNLIRSHSCGIGDAFSIPQARAMMLLRANTLARGHSGVRIAVVEKVLEFLNNGITPFIPCQGSVGASGDLAPLSHLALSLIGEGKTFGDDGRLYATKDLLKELKIAPLELKAKEGLSLINGCQVMTAVGLLAIHEAKQLAKIADIAGAMTLEALRGGRGPFDPLIAATRPHPGEAKTAKNILRILGETSGIAESHHDCTRVQDSYSLRCMPAVHGAVKDALNQIQKTLEIEANSSTDNPLVFAKEDKVLSCGNFHGMPVAFAMDYAGIVITSMASMSECRIAKLINPVFSDLPAFLAPNGGLNSGLMIVQVAAASLVSENKVLAHPASVDSIPTSTDKEDHVSMGTIAARKFVAILRNAQNVLAMELLSATQGIHLLAPLKAAAGVKAAFDLVSKNIPNADEDHVFSDDIETVRGLILSEKVVQVVETKVGVLEL